MDKNGVSVPSLCDRFYINGAWTVPSSDQRIDVYNAGTGKVLGKVPAGQAQDIGAAAA